MERYTADDLVALMEENVGDDLTPEVGIKEEMVVEVMQELWKEINNSDQHVNVSLAPANFPTSLSASPEESIFVVGGDNERCGAVISAAESTVMAGVGMGEYSGGEEKGKLCCSCKMDHGKMEGCDGEESEDEWLTRVLSMDPQEFEVDLMVVDAFNKKD